MEFLQVFNALALFRQFSDVSVVFSSFFFFCKKYPFDQHVSENRVASKFADLMKTGLKFNIISLVDELTGCQCPHISINVSYCSFAFSHYMIQIEKKIV